MPVKLDSPTSNENAEARIEIIPLIDIMFFLLASFMLVSLSMVYLKSVKVDLPAATTATMSDENKKDLADISVDKDGGLFLDGKAVASNELLRMLAESKRNDPNLHVLISGDRRALHGDIIHVLDIVRQAGIDQAAFDIGPSGKSDTP